MNAFDNSLSYRGVRQICFWLSQAAGCSVVGRTVVAFSRLAGRAAAASRSLGTERITSSRLGEAGQPASVLALSRPYLGLRGLLAGGAAGRALKAAGAGAEQARVSDGEWLRLVGTGLLGLGCGRAALVATGGADRAVGTAVGLNAIQGQVILAVILILLGLLAVLAGPRMIPALGDSAVGRGLGRLAARTRSDPSGVARAPGISVVVWVGMFLCATGGVIAGATGAAGPQALVAFILAVCALALVLWQPELILLVVAAFPWADWVARRTLGSLGPLWDDALVAVSIALLLWSVLVLGRGHLRTVPITLPCLLALVAAVGSVVIRRVPGDVALYGLRVLFVPLFFYFVGFLFPKRGGWVRWTVAVFLLAAVGLALHGLYQYATHAPMPPTWVDASEIGISTRAYSVVHSPIVLGSILAMGALISLGLALSSGLRGLRRVGFGVACVIQLGGLAVTFSRGAWLGLVAGILALLLLAYRKYLIPAFALGAVGWFAAPRVIIDRLLFAFGSTYFSRSAASGRVFRWEASLHHILDHPWFGVGLGTFGGTSAMLFGYWTVWTDNFYLAVAASGGLLLLAFFLWVLLRAGKGLVKGHRVTSDPYYRGLTAGTFGAFIAVVIANFFANTWETLAVGVEFWFLAGLATSAALQNGAPDTTQAVCGRGEEARAG